MSGSVAEALLASGSKKIPLLPPPPKIKKEPKTFSFNLELAESNDKTYPEFSWTELVRNSKQKELSKKAETGNPTLDPFASDDEEDLKAMAARFEAKYSSNPNPNPKKKRRAEDYIDRGAGYDETDPFIDNSDVYDEVVPADMQTVHGGFYINSGSLDFKEVELSEDEEDSLPQPLKLAKAKTKQTLPVKTGPGGVVIQKEKNPVGRPPGGGNKRTLPLDKPGVPKKKRLIITPVGPDNISVIKTTNKSNVAPGTSENKTQESVGVDGSKSSKAVNISSSSSSSSSSTSEESSSSSGSDSSSSEGDEGKKDKVKIVKNALKEQPVVPHSAPKQSMSNVPQKLDSTMPALVPQNPTPPKRLKTKNVPLNPKLHPNLQPPITSSSAVAAVIPINTTSPKVLNKDLIKTNGGGTTSSSRSASPRTQSPSGSIAVVPTSSPAIRVPTPKPVTTPSVSPGVTVSTVSAQATKPSNSNPISTKPKLKTHKPSVNSGTMGAISAMDILNSIPYSSLAGLPALNFPSTITAISTNASLLKGGGMNLLNSPKAMPNLKKIVTPPPDKLVHKHKAVGVQKPVKAKLKAAANNVAISTASHLSPFTNFGANPYLASFAAASAYKTPPPLAAGPGVEISKLRVAPSTSSGSTNPSKMSVNSSMAISTPPLGIGTATALTNSQLSLASSSLLSSGIVNTVSSSLTVSRLPQSITITPSPHPMYSAGDRNPVIPSSASSKTSSNATHQHHLETKPPKISAFDVSSLLQNSSSYVNSIPGMGNSTMGSKSTTGKIQNSIVNPRDSQRK